MPSSSVSRHIVSLITLILLICASGLPDLVQASSVPRPLIHLPADAAMHPDAANEWWYVVGHLHDAAGHTYGYELVTFKFSHLTQIVSSATYDTIYRSDVALTDETNKTFAGTVLYMKPQPPATRMSTSTLDVHAGPATFKQIGRQSYHFVQSVPGGGTLDLTAQSTKPPLLIGGQGLIPMGTSGTSYYYSLTHLVTTGTLTRNGKTTSLTGLSWMDHQWGNWDWKGLTGWDWMALQLNNGLDLNLSEFVHGRSRLKFVHFMPTGSTATIVRSASLTTLGPTWRSPVSTITYPSGWRVLVPSLGLDVTVIPTVKGQEMVNKFAKLQSYWEGSSVVKGTLKGKPITGVAYVELTGYGVPLSQNLNLGTGK